MAVLFVDGDAWPERSQNAVKTNFGSSARWRVSRRRSGGCLCAALGAGAATVGGATDIGVRELDSLRKPLQEQGDATAGRPLSLLSLTAQPTVHSILGQDGSLQLSVPKIGTAEHSRWSTFRHGLAHKAARRDGIGVRPGF